MPTYWSIVKKNHRYIFGNIIEWYDFSLYGYFSLIIMQQYFSFYPEAQALSATFLTFAVGIIARPIGAALFSWIADRNSPEYAFKLSVKLIAWPTFLIGILPGYAQWAISASIALVFLRLLQGISAGGQYGGCLALLMKNNPKNRAQACSLAQIGSVIGYLLAVGVCILSLTLIPKQYTNTLTWRIPFIMSLFLWWLQQRHFIIPTKMPTLKRKSTWKSLITHHKKPLTFAILLSSIGGLFYFSIFVYSISFLQQHTHHTLLQSLQAGAIAMTVSCLVLPYFAKLSDRYGRKPILIISCLGLLLFSPLIIYWLESSNTWLLTIACLCLLIVLNTLYIAAASVVYSEIFEPNVRYTGCNMAYNIGVILLGAPSPAILNYLVSHGSASSFGLYLSAGALLGLIVVLLMPETHKQAAPLFFSPNKECQ